MEENRVLVIMPCYNAEDTVTDAISTAINQTYKNFTLVCYDDKSTDNTLSVINELNKSLDFEIIQGDVNLGTGNAVNTAIKMSLEKSTYDYITWISADNKIASDFIEKHVNNLNAGNAISYSGWKQLGGVTVMTPNRNLLHLKDNFLLGPSFMFTRRLYETAGPFNPHAGEDYFFSVNCALNDAKFGYIDDALVEYRVHSNSVSGRLQRGEVSKLCSVEAKNNASGITKTNGTEIYK
jgi:glycosyltransferase involved in cell wall biosynthesis